MSGIGARLAKLEAGQGRERDGPEWWRIRKWLGHALTPEQEAAVARYESELPPYDPHAPLDTAGLSPQAVAWLSVPMGEPGSPQVGRGSDRLP